MELNNLNSKKGVIIMRIKILTASLLVAALSACGNSGGGSSPVGINSSNASQVAGISMLYVNSFAGFGSMGGNAVSGVQQGQGFQLDMKSFLNAQAAQIEQGFNNAGSGSSVAGIIASNTYNCNGVDTSGGTYSFSSDGSSSFTMTYTNCDMGGSIMNGTITGSFTSTGNTPPTTPWDVTGSMSYDLSVSTGASIVGTITMHLADDGTVKTTEFGMPSFEIKSGSQYATVSDYSYSLVDDSSAATATTTINGKVDTSDLGGYITITTLSPFVKNSGDPYPATGSIKIAGEGGSYIILDANTGYLSTYSLTVSDGSSVTTTTESWTYTP